MHAGLDPKTILSGPIPGLTSDDLVYSLALLELKIENSIVKCDLLDFYLPALSFSGLSKGAAFPT